MLRERTALHNAFRESGVKVRQLHQLFFVGNIRLDHPLTAPDLSGQRQRPRDKIRTEQLAGLEKQTFSRYSFILSFDSSIWT